MWTQLELQASSLPRQFERLSLLPKLLQIPSTSSYLAGQAVEEICEEFVQERIRAESRKSICLANRGARTCSSLGVGAGAAAFQPRAARNDCAVRASGSFDDKRLRRSASRCPRATGHIAHRCTDAPQRVNVYGSVRPNAQWVGSPDYPSSTQR